MGRSALAVLVPLTLLALPAAAASADPAPPPAGLMVFICQAGSQWDLFAWEPGGGEAPRRLTETPVDELSPSLSADRTRVAYTDSAGALWLLDLADGAAGGAPRRLSTAEEANRLLQPALSPDGGELLAVYRADRARDETDLVIRRTAPGGAAEASFGPAWEPLKGAAATWRLPMVSSQFSPAWAPDGRRFAFTHLHARWTGSVISEIWEARVDHSLGRQLTLLDGFCDEPAWSPGGDEIAFSCDRPDQFEIYAVAVDTRRVRRLTNDPAADTSPVYGPDGRYLAFDSTRDGIPALYLLDLRGGGVEKLHPFPDGDRPCKEPDWR